MEDTKKLEEEFLEATNGGTISESAALCAQLLLAGKGFFGALFHAIMKPLSIVRFYTMQRT